MCTNTTPQAEERETNDAPNIHSVMYKLWERTADSLSEKELAWFARASCQASFLMSHLSEVTEKIGHCIADIENGGAYEDKDSISGLLHFISESINNIQALFKVGNSASQRLIHKEFYKGRAAKN
jgi:hypothetical protein